MAVTTTTQQMNLSFLSAYMTHASVSKQTPGLRRNTITNIVSGLTLSLRDSFTSKAAGERLREMVLKARSAGAIVSVSSSRTLDASGPTPSFAAPSRAEIDTAVAAAGGRSALDPWLVDGWTQLDVNGRTTMVNVAGNEKAQQQPADARQAAAASIARFGLSESMLDEDPSAILAALGSEAEKRIAENPALTAAIQYALGDAYAKMDSLTGKGAAAADMEYEKQVAINMAQVSEVVSQLNLGNGDVWGVESLARDLAVFGLDLTAISGDPQELVQKVKDRSLEMIADLNERFAGSRSSSEYDTQLRKITGASARLVNGLQGSAGSVIRASASANVSTSVTVGGVNVDASAIIAIGNVIVDPLVLDLNGDGIDLKGAEEGVDFDMNGDGTKTTMGFVRGDDALLFVDEHGDGVVRDGRQLFGNSDGYANGFEKLREYDDNGDGVIDENDAIYDKLRLWVEKKEDGVCDQDETMSLREAGVKSISLGYENVREDDGKGNLIGQTGTFTRDDGTEGYAADVWLQEKRTPFGE